MRGKWKYAYMDCALRFASMSRSRELKVGALLVRHDTPLGWGFNGTPPGEDNTCESKELGPTGCSTAEFPYIDEDGSRYKWVTNRAVIHAEDNALRKLTRSGESGVGASLFVTVAPCTTCAARVVDAGVVSVYYLLEYKNSAGIEYLRKHGVVVEQLNYQHALLLLGEQYVHEASQAVQHVVMIKKRKPNETAVRPICKRCVV